MAALVFTLSMPGSPSWNGRWSGEGRLYAKIVPIRPTKRHEAKCAPLDGKRWSYGWRDGWRASIECKIVSGSELTKIRKASVGFCGYDWMVDSIMRDGEIYGPDKPKPEPAVAAGQ